jgi:para-aminobenzoate synthetase/4-amino-4-deoxychorismate lyase
MTTKKRKNPSLLDARGLFSAEAVEWIAHQPHAVLLESTLADGTNQRSFLFLKPRRVLKATSLETIERRLRDVQSALDDGYYVAGFVCYEAGYVFEPLLKRECSLQLPFVWFGVYDEPIIFNRSTQRFEKGKQRAALIEAHLREQMPTRPEKSFLPSCSLNLEEYRESLDTIRQYIEEGDTYQVNYTMTLKFPWTASAGLLYRKLTAAQRVGYSAMVSLGDRKLLSVSPELFFRIEKNRITMKPMKGTIARGRTLEEDRVRIEELQHSEKNRAENLMIVDLLRNDLGRIARTGSVNVGRSFEIERYETLFQATSTITAELKKTVGVPELFQSLFPSGSVTGAPKIRTMQIIQELEREPRGIYTGAIGFFSPKKQAVFNVAIRTVVLDERRRRAEMGVGSGIVHDSIPEDEYQECLLKAKFLTESPAGFELIETMRWTPGRSFFLLREHLGRLERSAEYFGFPFVRKEFTLFLKRYETILRRESKKKLSFRVRLAMNGEGKFKAVHFRLEPPEKNLYVLLSSQRANSSDRFLFHKTTNRFLYDKELERTILKGYFDVIFLNEQNQVTEGARSNILIKKQGQWLTPPLSCGLLPGTYREHLLRSKKYSVQEQILTLEDLMNADEVYVCNAVRGMMQVRIDGLS